MSSSAQSVSRLAAGGLIALLLCSVARPAELNEEAAERARQARIEELHGQMDYHLGESARIRKAGEASGGCTDEQVKQILYHRGKAKEAFDESEKLRRQSEAYALRKQVTLETKDREERIKDLRRFFEGLEGSLRRLDRGADWQEELDHWVKESQEAQVDAILSSVGLLLGDAGPFEEAIRAHTKGAKKALGALTKHRAEFEESRKLVKEGIRQASTEEIIEAYRSVRKMDNALGKVLSEELSATVRLAAVRELGKDVQQLATLIKQQKAVMDPLARQDFQKALQAVSEICLNLCLDSVTKDLAVAQRHTAARQLQLARWTVDYGYQSFRFGVAWKNVNAINRRIETELDARTKIKKRREEIYRQIEGLEKEVGKLKAVPVGNVSAMRNVLSEVKATADER
jgi:hypothetical protein